MSIVNRPASVYVGDLQRHFQLFYNAIDVFGRMTGAISALTAEPFKEIGCYLFPQAGSFLSGHTAMDEKQDPALEAQMPLKTRVSVLNEVNALIKAAGLQDREIIPYCSSKNDFEYMGGAFSSSLILPKDQLFRIGKNGFGEETPADNLAQETYRFTDGEVRFLTARLLAHIKHNDDLIRVAVKVLLIAAVLLTLLTPIGFAFGLSIFGALLALHTLSQRHLQKRADIQAIEILKNLKVGDVQEHAEAAISALEKLRKQNIDKRSALFGTLLYSKEGNDRLALGSTSLTQRIALIREKFLPPRAAAAA